MPGPRISRSYKVFKDGVFYREFSARNEMAKYMIKNYFSNVSLNYMYSKLISLHPHGGQTNYHGFTFEKDPSWIPSKKTRAFNEVTNHEIITESRGEMHRMFFDRMDRNAGVKISRLIKTGERYNGYRFEDISVGYLDCPNGGNDDYSSNIPLIGTDIVTGEIILCLSMTDGARHVMRTSRTSSDDIMVVRSNIRNAARNYMGGSNVVYGYRWSFPE